MSGHRDAPWKVVNDAAIHEAAVNGYRTTAVSVSAQNSSRAVALVYAGFGDGPETARLIAAAPDLLAALQAMAESYDARRCWDKDRKVCPERLAIAAAAEAAIAKAVQS